MTFPSNNLPSDAKYWVREVEKKIVNLQNSLSSSDINNTTRDSQLQVTASQALIAAQAAEAAAKDAQDAVDGLEGLGTDGSIYGIDGGNIIADTITANEIDSDYIYAGTIDANQINAGILTGFTIRTSASGRRVEVSGTDNGIKFVDQSGDTLGWLAPATFGGTDYAIALHTGTTANVVNSSAPNLYIGQHNVSIEGDTNTGIIVADGSPGLWQGMVAILTQNELYIEAGGGNAFKAVTNSAGQLETEEGFRVASGGTLSVALGAELKYDMPQETGTTYPVYFNNTTKLLYRLSSSARYKTEIKDAVIDYEKFLSIPVRTFKNSKEVESLGSDKAEATYGYIAEELHDAGLTEFVVYENDENGNPRPESVNYMSMAVATHGAISVQNKKMAELEARLSELEGK